MNPYMKSAVIWGSAAVILAIIAVTKNNAAMVLSASFFMKFLAVIVGSIFGLAGAMLGDAIRRFALPDGFFTTGGMGSILKTKLFWMAGPQLIGLFIGVFMGVGVVLQ